MKKLLFTLFTIHYSLFTLLQAAGVEAVLSQTEVVQGNPAQLKIIAEGEGVKFPDIRQIGDVPVEGSAQQQNTSLQIINGKSAVAHTTTLVLTFTPTKDMQIPAYDVEIEGKHYKTKPMHLKVIKSTAPNSTQTGAFSLTMKADKSKVVVGEPLVVKVYFSVRSDVRLSDNPQYNRPEFKGFFVKEIGDQKNYFKGDHRITELRYVLVPQKAGHYRIAPATAKIGVADTSRRDIFGRYFGTDWKPLRSNALEIDVEPLPQDTDLVGRFYIDSHIDTTETKPNKPVNLTVKIEGDGSLEDYEMPEYTIDDVTVYSDDAEVTTTVIGDKLKSTYVKKFAFIADHDFVIPERILTAFDPKSKEVKTLKIPGYSIRVEAPKSAAGTATVSSEPHSGEVQTNVKPDAASVSETERTQIENPVSVPAWWMLVLAFAGGMVTMFLLGKIQWKRNAFVFKESEALKILYGHMSDDPAVEEMVRKLYAKKNGHKDVTIDKRELKALVEKYRLRQ